MIRLRPRNSDDNSSNNDNLSYQVARRLRDLDFSAFHRCVFLWLGARGYRHLQPLNRHYRRGRRQNAGIDFVAVLPGTNAITLAIQVRHWRTPLQRRAVDELWGQLLRRGIPAALIVTNVEVWQAARQAVEQYPGRPIQIISVEQLATSMAGLGLGVTDQMKIDQQFFDTLQSLSFASEPVKPVDRSRRGRRERAEVVPATGRRTNVAAEERTLTTIIWLLVFICSLMFWAFLAIFFGGR